MQQVSMRFVDALSDIAVPDAAAGVPVSVTNQMQLVTKDLSQYQQFANVFFQYRINAVVYRFIPNWTLGINQDQVNQSGYTSIIFAVAPVQSATGSVINISTSMNQSTFMALHGARACDTMARTGKIFTWRQKNPRAIGASVNDIAAGTFIVNGNAFDPPKRWYTCTATGNETDKQMFLGPCYFIRGPPITVGAPKIRVERYTYISFRKPFAVGAAGEGEDADDQDDRITGDVAA